MGIVVKWDETRAALAGRARAREAPLWDVLLPSEPSAFFVWPGWSSHIELLADLAQTHLENFSVAPLIADAEANS